ncbi:MAG: carboxynorspermidine decarboxylase [Erysipelotrichaceae bacterium]
MEFDVSKLPTPCYVVSEAKLRKNLECLADVQARSGCKILLAQKAFSMFRSYSLCSQYLAGTTASGLYEAKLGYQYFGKETHVYAPAFKQEDMKELVHMVDHIVFNSLQQYHQHKTMIRSSKRTISIGLRIHPEHQEGLTPMYDPCAENSRMGIKAKHLEASDWDGIDGLHFHTLCEQDFAPLERTLAVVEAKFGHILPQLSWVNFGGGHHITRAGYDVEGLIACIQAFQAKYQVQVYLEPGEAIALDAGYLVSEVLEVQEHSNNVILDVSAACHMPDVLEMPYRPHIIGSGLPKEKPYSYCFGGNTCLAGDVIGEYTFEKPLRTGDRLVFCDMAIYSMVKNNTFNGIGLPSIVWLREDKTVELVKKFGFEEFRSRLS